MANKYTNIFSTKPVSTYRPLPIEHFSNLSQQIRQRYDLQKAQDAKTRMALRKAQSMFTTPELQEGASNILQNNVARLDDLAANSNPEDSFIETQMIAEDAASSLASLQQAEQSKLADLEAIREAAEENNLSFEEAMALYEGGIEYDPNTMTASYTGRRPSYAKRMNAGEIITQIGSPKANQTFRTTEDGRTVLVEGVTETDAAIVARDALELNPEWQQSQRQDMQIYAAQARQAEGGPQEKLDEYINSLPAASKADAMERVAERKADGYEADAIYADLRASDKTARALGFAANRFAFTSLSSKGEGSSGGGYYSNRYFDMSRVVSGRAVNNPALGDAPETLPASFNELLRGLSDIEDPTLDGTALAGKTSAGAPPTYWSEDGKILTGGLEGRKEALSDITVEDLIEKGTVKENYADTLRYINEIAPQQEGEDINSWLARAKPLYDEIVTYHSSLRNEYNPIRPEMQEDFNNSFFGKGSDKRIGTVTDREFIVTTVAGESEIIHIEDIADANDMTIKEAAERLTAIGITSEADALGIPSVEVRLPTEEGKFLFWGGDQKVESLKMIRSDQGDIRRLRPLVDINSLRHDITRNSTDVMDISGVSLTVDVDGESRQVQGDLKLRAKAEPVFRDGTYAGRKIIIEHLADDGSVLETYDESDVDFYKIMSAIKNR